jgi:hypothetical protein
MDGVTLDAGLHWRREAEGQVAKGLHLEGEEAGTGTEQREGEEAREETIARHKAPPVSKEGNSRRRKSPTRRDDDRVEGRRRAAVVL